MKKLLLAALILALLIGSAGYALSAPPPAPGLRVVLREATGPVTVTSSDGSARTAAAGMDLAEGDTITTGEGGGASVEFFDGSRLGVDAATTVIIRTADVGDPDWRDQDVSVETVSGRVWARVLKLLDKDSSFEVRHSDVVALVRGTAFLFTDTLVAARIDAFDGTIAVRDGSAASAEVPAGFSLLSGAAPSVAAGPAGVFATPDDIRNDRWVREQLKKDEEFAARATDARRASIGGGSPVLAPLVTIGGAIRRLLDQPRISPAPKGAFDIAGIGEEAGPYTLAFEEHSNFQGVRIEGPVQLSVDDVVGFRAFAYFSDGSPEQEVTDLDVWQLSDPTRASIDDAGTLVGLAPGEVAVVARWNDGTHEHSGTVTVRVSPASASAVRPAVTTMIETSAELKIGQ